MKMERDFIKHLSSKSRACTGIFTLVDILGRKKDPKINDLYFHLWKLEGGEQIKSEVCRKKEKQERN